MAETAQPLIAILITSIVIVSITRLIVPTAIGNKNIFLVARRGLNALHYALH